MLTLPARVFPLPRASRARRSDRIGEGLIGPPPTCHAVHGEGVMAESQSADGAISLARRALTQQSLSLFCGRA